MTSQRSGRSILHRGGSTTSTHLHPRISALALAFSSTPSLRTFACALSSPFLHGGNEAYIDNKTFVVARTAKDKKLMRSTRISHHLRKPDEGAAPGCVVPKKSRMYHGLKSLEVTAAVAKGRIIMWHVSKKPWCGAVAAAMYEKLGQALRKTWGTATERDSSRQLARMPKLLQRSSRGNCHPSRPR